MSFHLNLSATLQKIFDDNGVDEIIYVITSDEAPGKVVPISNDDPTYGFRVFEKLATNPGLFDVMIGLDVIGMDNPTDLVELETA